ncbi:MAG: S8 family serine peptidase [Actinomycetota bacterium]
MHPFVEARRLAPIVIAVLAAFLFAPAAGHAAAVSAGEVLVQFKPGTSSVAQSATIARNAGRIVSSIRGIGYKVVSFDSRIPLDAELASFRRDPNVAHVEPNYQVQIAADDPCLTQSCAGQSGQWATSMTAAFSTWDTTYTAASKKTLPEIIVAVLDTKVDQSHPDFINSGGSSTDAAQGGQIDAADARDWIPSDQQSGWAEYHGTYVSGLVAASTDNGSGVASIGARATILPLTVVNGNGVADAASLADAIVYAWQKGARVINLSLGLAQDSAAVHDAIIQVTQGAHPSLVVAAAGNNTGSNAFYPGSYPEVMSVAGTAASDQPASCSNYNSNVSVSAPAENVVSLSFGGGYTAPQCGTSAAAPQVSGLAADLFAQQPSRTPQEVRQIIESSADHLGPAGRNDHFGFGRINADRALHSSGPSTTLAAATPVINGSSTIAALATASSTIRAARVFVDRIDSSPFVLNAKDGSFDSSNESLIGKIQLSLSSGPHPIFVQSFDGSTWGPVTVGVLFVPSKPPVISNASVTNAVRATGQPASISFTISDEMPYNVNWGIQVFDSTNKEVFRTYAANVPQGPCTYNWSPSMSVLPGNYKIKIIAADATGWSSAAMIGTMVA